MPGSVARFAIVLLLVLAGCGSSSPEEAEPPATSPAEQAPPPVTEDGELIDAVPTSTDVSALVSKAFPDSEGCTFADTLGVNTAGASGEPLRAERAITWSCGEGEAFGAVMDSTGDPELRGAFPGVGVNCRNYEGGKTDCFVTKGPILVVATSPSEGEEDARRYALEVAGML